MAKDRVHISINSGKCTACSTMVCVGVCPEGILEPDEAKKPRVVEEILCSGCGVCANLCPAKAITLKQNRTATC